MLSHGFVDQIVERSKLRKTLSSLLQLHGYLPEQDTQTEEVQAS